MMSDKPEIKAVAFDAYGTLFDVHSVIALCEELFPGKGAAISEAWRSRQLQYTWLRALMNRYEDFWRVTESALIFACKSLGLDYEPAAIDALMQAYLTLEPYPEVREALSALSALPLAILSNGSPAMLDAAAESAGIRSALSHIISVDEIQTFKPHPDVYRLAERKLGIEKSSIAFVSSNAWDAVGAAAYGLWTCWVNRGKAAAEELGFSPAAEVDTLTELAAILID